MARDNETENMAVEILKYGNKIHSVVVFQRSVDYVDSNLGC